MNLPDFWWPPTISTTNPYLLQYFPWFNGDMRLSNSFGLLAGNGLSGSCEGILVDPLAIPWSMGPGEYLQPHPPKSNESIPKMAIFKAEVTGVPNYDFGYLSFRGDVPRFIWVTNPSSELLMLLGLAPAQFGALSILWLWNQSRSLKPPPLKKTKWVVLLLMAEILHHLRSILITSWQNPELSRLP